MTASTAPTAPILPPPTGTVGPIGWLRQNLFSSLASSLVTIILGVVLAVVAVELGRWAISEARWGVVTANFRLFLIGQYPLEAAWRLWLSLLLVSTLSGLSAGTAGGTVRTLATWLAAGQALLAGLAFLSELGPVVPAALLANAVVLWVTFFLKLGRFVPRPALTWAWLLSIPVSAILLVGIGGPPLEPVNTNLWGGLLLTFLLALVGILLSFPFGVLLALGRRSSLPAVRLLSTAYIELIRAVPLVTVLFMASIMLPLFLPGEIRVDRVLRAMGGITLFSAAYVAENVRGGLQAIPSGQIEAAQALGLSTYRMNRHIVLPQALRSVIPANVGLFISLLKDTTLVYILGLLEILGIGRAVLAQSQWFGAQMEVYAFVAAVFFVLCYTMSQASYRLEEALGVGTR